MAISTETTRLSGLTAKQISAELYKENSSLQQNHANHLISMIQVPVGGLVMDLGCGTGYLATVLSDLVGPKGKVVAVDPDVERINIAKEVNSKPNIEYMVGDDQCIPGKDYDLIVSTHVIHWIRNKEALFGNIRKKLTVNGFFGFVTYNGRPIHQPVIKKAMHELISPDFEDGIFKTMTFEVVDTYKSMAQRAGFQIDSVKVFPWDIWFKDTDSFLDYWAGVMQGDFSLDSIDKQKLEQFKTEHELELKATSINTVVLCVVMKNNPSF